VNVVGVIIQHNRRKMILFVLCLVGVLFVSSFSLNAQPEVALCIGGQLPRLQPDLLIPLFAANAQFNFKVFYSLQYTNVPGEAKFWSDSNFVFNPSKVGLLKVEYVEQALKTTYHILDNVKVAAVKFGKGLTSAEWSTKHFNRKPLTAIQLPVSQPEIVLNMLAKQSDCAEQIIQFETERNMTFDYVLWGREDLHFYKALDLPLLTSLLHPAPRGLDAVVTKQSLPGQGCQLLVRNCLTHGGLPLRGYVWPRAVAIPAMQARMHHYLHLLERNLSVITVEAFEDHFMQQQNISVCHINKDLFPTVAVRHTVKGGFCIPPTEMSKRCFPTKMESYVSKKVCKKATFAHVQKHSDP